MIVVKILIYICIFFASSGIGILISKRYSNRVKELKEFKNALNIFKAKIKFTHEPIPEVFAEISKAIETNTGNIFKIASNNMKLETAGVAWEKALDSGNLNIYNEDKEILKNLSKLLGKTDIDGQISIIELTSSFLEEQILKAEEQKGKSEKMCKSLGMIFGIAIIIILI